MNVVSSKLGSRETVTGGVKVVSEMAWLLPYLSAKNAYMVDHLQKSPWKTLFQDYSPLVTPVALVKAHGPCDKFK